MVRVLPYGACMEPKHFIILLPKIANQQKYMVLTIYRAVFFKEEMRELTLY